MARRPSVPAAAAAAACARPVRPAAVSAWVAAGALLLGAAWALPARAAGDAAAPAKPMAKPAPGKGGPSAMGKVAEAPVAVPTDSPAEAMNQLRLKLGDKLAATGRSGDSKPGEVKLAVKTGSAPAAPSGPARKGVAKAAPVEAPVAPVPWGYSGAGAPAEWAKLKPEYALCGQGQRQSPIDIRGGLAVDLEPVKFDYQSSRFAVIDTGHTVQVNLPTGSAIEVGGKRYELRHFHFRRPSEERIDGRQFEMSLQLLHRNEQGQLVIVSVLFDKGPPHPALQQVWNNLPLEKHEENAARQPINLAELLPSDRRYYTYMGSLTTPPCSEGVQWIVMRQPATMTAEQIELFARIYPMNARPVQPLGGRRILQSN